MVKVQIPNSKSSTQWWVQGVQSYPSGPSGRAKLDWIILKKKKNWDKPKEIQPVWSQQKGGRWVPRLRWEGKVIYVARLVCWAFQSDLNLTLEEALHSTTKQVCHHSLDELDYRKGKISMKSREENNDQYTLEAKRKYGGVYRGG